MPNQIEMDKLTEAKRRLVAEYRSLAGFSGVGIGSGRTPGSLALRVMVADASAAKRIPSTFSGVDVLVDVVGKIKAL